MTITLLKDKILHLIRTSFPAPDWQSSKLISKRYITAYMSCPPLHTHMNSNHITHMKTESQKIRSVIEDGLNLIMQQLQYLNLHSEASQCKEYVGQLQLFPPYDSMPIMAKLQTLFSGVKDKISSANHISYQKIRLLQLFSEFFRLTELQEQIDPIAFYEQTIDAQQCRRSRIPLTLEESTFIGREFFTEIRTFVFSMNDIIKSELSKIELIYLNQSIPYSECAKRMYSYQLLMSEKPDILARIDPKLPQRFKKLASDTAQAVYSLEEYKAKIEIFQALSLHPSALHLQSGIAKWITTECKKQDRQISEMDRTQLRVYISQQFDEWRENIAKHVLEEAKQIRALSDNELAQLTTINTFIDSLKIPNKLFDKIFEYLTLCCSQAK